MKAPKRRGKARFNNFLPEYIIMPTKKPVRYVQTFSYIFLFASENALSNFPFGKKIIS